MAGGADVPPFPPTKLGAYALSMSEVSARSPLRANKAPVAADLYAREKPASRVALHCRQSHLQERGDLARGHELVEMRATNVLRLFVVAR